jgi:hypothetical protein
MPAISARVRAIGQLSTQTCTSSQLSLQLRPLQAGALHTASRKQRPDRLQSPSLSDEQAGSSSSLELSGDEV